MSIASSSNTSSSRSCGSFSFSIKDLLRVGTTTVTVPPSSQTTTSSTAFCTTVCANGSSGTLGFLLPSTLPSTVASLNTNKKIVVNGAGVEWKMMGCPKNKQLKLAADKYPQNGGDEPQNPCQNKLTGNLNLQTSSFSSMSSHELLENFIAQQKALWRQKQMPNQNQKSPCSNVVEVGDTVTNKILDRQHTFKNVHKKSRRSSSTSSASNLEQPHFLNNNHLLNLAVKEKEQVESGSVSDGVKNSRKRSHGDASFAGSPSNLCREHQQLPFLQQQQQQLINNPLVQKQFSEQFIRTPGASVPSLNAALIDPAPILERLFFTFFSAPQQQRHQKLLEKLKQQHQFLLLMKKAAAKTKTKQQRREKGGGGIEDRKNFGKKIPIELNNTSEGRGCYSSTDSAVSPGAAITAAQEAVCSSAALAKQPHQHDDATEEKQQQLTSNNNNLDYGSNEDYQLRTMQTLRQFYSDSNKSDHRRRSSYPYPLLQHQMNSMMANDEMSSDKAKSVGFSGDTLLRNTNSSSSIPKMKKKTRTVFTRLQINQLESCFDAHKYLNSAQRSQLAQKLRLSETQVKTWFQNHRNKFGGELIREWDGSDPVSITLSNAALAAAMRETTTASDTSGEDSQCSAATIPQLSPPHQQQKKEELFSTVINEKEPSFLHHQLRHRLSPFSLPFSAPSQFSPAAKQTGLLAPAVGSGASQQQRPPNNNDNNFNANANANDANEKLMLLFQQQQFTAATQKGTTMGAMK